jgi:hypothetical protein
MARITDRFTSHDDVCSVPLERGIIQTKFVDKIKTRMRFAYWINYYYYYYYYYYSILRVVKTRRMRWARHVARMRESRVVHGVLVGRPEGKRPFGRPRSRWEDNIKMDLQEGGGGCGEWMELA